MKSIFLFVWMILACFDSQAFKNPDSTIIKGVVSSLHEGDTVVLYIDKYGNFNADKELNITYKTAIKNGGYKFSTVISFPAYFTLILNGRDPKVNLYSILVEPGYQLLIKTIGQDTVEFSGKGSDRLNVQYQNRKIRTQWFRKINGWDTSQIRKTFSILDSCSIKQAEHLKANRKSLGERAYTILYADILGESGLKIDNFLIYSSPAAVEKWRRTLFDYKDEFWEKYNVFDSSNDFLKYSYTYSKALIAKYRWDSCIIIRQPFNIRNCYEYFKYNYRGSLREKIITTLLYDNKKKPEDISFCLTSSLSYVINKDFVRILTNIAHLTKGSIVYNFDLPDTSGIRHFYSDFVGKVVLLDFWFTGCTGCVELKPKMDSIISLFKDDQIVFISISIDKSKSQWIGSIRKGMYTSEQSINLYTDGRGDTHPIISYYVISGYPRLILIDKEGRLCNNPLDPRLDNGVDLIKLINQSLKL